MTEASLGGSGIPRAVDAEDEITLVANVLRMELRQLLLESIGGGLPGVVHKRFELVYIYMSKKLKHLYDGMLRVEQNLGHLMDIPDQTDNDICVVKLNEEYQ